MKNLSKISKITQHTLHILVVLCDIVLYIMLLKSSEAAICLFGVALLLTYITAILPANRKFYHNWFHKGLDGTDWEDGVASMLEKKSDENVGSPEISDETIMKVLNAIGYEEESWIPVVREHLRKIESEPEN